MKKNSNNHARLIGLAALIWLAVGGHAQASSSFNSQATISFSLGSAANAVTVASAYAPADPGYSYIFQAPGSIGEILPAPDNAIAIPALGLDAAHTFAVSGYATAGSFSSQHIGWYQLDFLNQSSQDQQVALTLSYTMQTLIQGEADSDVVIDFSDGDALLANAFFNNSLLNVEAYDPAIAIASDKSAITYNFVLAQGEARTFYTDVTINAALQPAPVPLPAAAWSFLIGLMGLLGVKKRKSADSALA